MNFNYLIIYINKNSHLTICIRELVQSFDFWILIRMIFTSEVFTIYLKFHNFMVRNLFSSVYRLYKFYLKPIPDTNNWYILTYELRV